MAGINRRNIEVGTDTGFMGQNAGKQFMDSAVFDASSLLPGGPVNEVQVVSLTGAPSGGTFTLGFGGQTTAALPFNTGVANVETGLNALSSIGAAGVRVTGQAGGPWFVHFEGASLKGVDQALITGNASGLTGGATPAVLVGEMRKGKAASGDPRILINSADFPTAAVKVVTVGGREKVQFYNGTGTIVGFIDGVMELISNDSRGDVSLPLYAAAGLVVDASKVRDYSLYKSAIDAFAASRAITIKHGGS